MQQDVVSNLRFVSVFSHVNAEKAELYRTILQVFMEAKASGGVTKEHAAR